MTRRELQLRREQHFNWGVNDARRDKADGRGRRVKGRHKSALPKHDPDYCRGYEAFWTGVAS